MPSPAAAQNLLDLHSRRLACRASSIFAVACSLLLASGCNQSERKWEEARRIDTPQAYQQFLLDEPGSAHREEAIRRVGEMELAEASAVDRKDERVLRLVSIAMNVSEDRAPLTARAQTLLNDASDAADLDPRKLADSAPLKEYLERYPDVRLASRISTLLNVQAAAGKQAAGVKRLVGRAQKGSSEMYVVKVEGGELDGMMPLGALIAVSRSTKLNIQYHLQGYGVSIDYGDIVRPKRPPEVGAFVEIYMLPGYFNLSGVLAPDPKLVGLWYAEGKS